MVQTRTLKQNFFKQFQLFSIHYKITGFEKFNIVTIFLLGNPMNLWLI